MLFVSLYDAFRIVRSEEISGCEGDEGYSQPLRLPMFPRHCSRQPDVLS